MPLPTSPISSRCIGCARPRSPSISSMRRRWSPVSSNGSESSQAPTASPRAGSAIPSVSRDAPAAAGDQRRLVEEQLLEGEALRARPRRHARQPGSATASGSRRRPPCAAPGAGGRESAPRRAGPSASPARPTRGCAAGAVARSPGAPGRPRWCAGQRALGHVESRNSCSATLKPRFSSLPRSSSRVPGPQPVRQPGAVEPDGLHLAARIRRPPRGSSGAGGESAAASRCATSTSMVASSPSLSSPMPTGSARSR